jgi:5-methyltetrahydropteroyltriglutamate--homocysteine methyltransferase
MQRSTDRIRTTHAGTLPRPDDLRDLVLARDSGSAVDEATLTARARSAIAGAVKQQIDAGIDVVNDGELTKGSFTNYVRDRLTGHETRPIDLDAQPASIAGRDMLAFPEYWQGRGLFGQPANPTTEIVCSGPIRYVGQEAVRQDIANFKAALAGIEGVEAFLPAVAPGTIEHWLRNLYYPSEEAYLEVLADAMHEEYQAITDAGLILQIDDPDLPDGYQMYPNMDVPAYRKYAQIRIEALNHALRGLPEEQVRFHTCWGSYKGPHKFDIPLRDIADLMLSVRAQAYSIEASNPVHEHEWQVWKEIKLPDGKILIPGVIGHYCDFIEHPQLVADRLVRYAGVVGRENVMAGTDCGIGSRVGHAKICWAKFEAMAEGARIATERLWGRA